MTTTDALHILHDELRDSRAARLLGLVSRSGVPDRAALLRYRRGDAEPRDSLGLRIRALAEAIESGGPIRTVGDVCEALGVPGSPHPEPEVRRMLTDADPFIAPDRRDRTGECYAVANPHEWVPRETLVALSATATPRVAAKVRRLLA